MGVFMNDVLLWGILAANITIILLVIVILFKSSRKDSQPAEVLREEIRLSREEARVTGKELRDEVATGLRSANEIVFKTLETIGSSQKTHLEYMTRQLKELAESNQASLEHIRTTIDTRVKDLHEGNEKKLDTLRKESSESLKTTNETLLKTLDSISKVQQDKLEGMTKNIRELIDANQVHLEKIRLTFDKNIKELQGSNEQKIDLMRKESTEGLKSNNETLSKTMESMNKTQLNQLESMTKQLKEITESNQSSLDRIRNLFDERIKELQQGNEKKLEEMRKTVDEQLHNTLEKRLGESFKLVSDRLEAVHKGLGEMQNLATGVGDLKRVLTNVKARGTWAEVQLGAILEQILNNDQYEKNVQVRSDSSERVEFAIKLPGAKEDSYSCVWLPIDSKFPQEDYLRLQEASEKADPAAVQAATDALIRTVRASAKDIHDKYVYPPYTTDFGIMFLATEGLYAEVLRQSSVVEELQQRFRVVIAGPTTLAAILNSLRMGFQTLAIEQRAVEVWRVLGAIKTEFGKFGETLDRVKRQLNSASRTIEQTGVRSRAMERKLRSVEQLPEAEASEILLLPPAGQEMSEDDIEHAET
jgi:DNA recombination protein RmuC